MDALYLHKVIVKKDVGLIPAFKMAQNIIQDENKAFVRETEDSYHFRNIPKTYFDRKTFRSKVVNDQVTLVFGKLKHVQSS